MTLKPGDRKIATAHLENTSFKILLSATAFQTEGKIYKLIAFQNVNEALDETESKAWQKLLSVMTHEIMNSVAPISSLADTLKHRLQQSVAALNNDSGSVDDLELGIETIKRRSEGLLKFAETYRNLNKITTLNLKKIYVRDIFENLLQLMQPTLEQKNIELETILKDPDLPLEADTNLLEQVLINLVVNAIEAVKESPIQKLFYLLISRLITRRSLRLQTTELECLQKFWKKYLFHFSARKKVAAVLDLAFANKS